MKSGKASKPSHSSFHFSYAPMHEVVPNAVRIADIIDALLARRVGWSVNHPSLARGGLRLWVDMRGYSPAGESLVPLYHY